MSYRNPKIYAVDPLAFTKSFTQSFNTTLAAFQNVAKQVKQQREKDDLIKAELLKYGNIGALDGISKEVNSAIQESVYGLVDQEAFTEMSAVQRQEKLLELSQIKSGLEKFVGYYAIDPEELSERSMLAHKGLHAIIHQLKIDPSSVSISGDLSSLDVNLSYTDEDGEVHKTSMRDMNRFSDTYISVEEDRKFYNEFLGNDAKALQARIDTYATRLNRSNAKEEVLNQYFNESYELSDDMKAYIYYELLDDKSKSFAVEGDENTLYTAYNLGGEGDLNSTDKAELVLEQERLIKDTYREILSDKLFATPTPPEKVTVKDPKQFEIEKQSQISNLIAMGGGLVNYANNVLNSNDPKLYDGNNRNEKVSDQLANYANNVLQLSNVYTGKNAPMSVIDEVIKNTEGDEAYKVLVKAEYDEDATDEDKAKLAAIRQAIKENTALFIDGEQIKFSDQNISNNYNGLAEYGIYKLISKYGQGSNRLNNLEINQLYQNIISQLYSGQRPVPFTTSANTENVSNEDKNIMMGTFGRGGVPNAGVNMTFAADKNN